MHFSIPETADSKDEKQNLSFVVYNIHVNGSFHCTVRYKQLHSFHEQLKKAFDPNSLPVFPPKRFFPLSSSQIEERRSTLEKYIQTISQDEKIFNSELFNAFFLNAQQESLNHQPITTKLEVYLMNWSTLEIEVSSVDNTGAILETVGKAIDLQSKYLPYFAVYMVKRVVHQGNNHHESVDSQSNGDDHEDDHSPDHLVGNRRKRFVLIRKMQNFESPYLSLQTANHNSNNSYCLVIRKCYWDSSYDDDLLGDRVALNLLYGQTLCDVEQGWIQTTKEVRRQLNTLQTKGSKRDYVLLARTLKYYGYLQFESCQCNYPMPNTRVIILAGGRELILRVCSSGPDQSKEFSFRVTRIRCWRLTTSPTENNNGTSKNGHSTKLNDGDRSGGGGVGGGGFTRYELSFEYLISKDVLKWITISSPQAILISMCLRGMVEELLMKRKGLTFTSPTSSLVTNGGQRRESWSYMKRDGSCHSLNIPRSVSSDSAFLNGDSKSTSSSSSSLYKGKRISSKSDVGNKARTFVENDAFDGIGDDDL